MDDTGPTDGDLAEISARQRHDVLRREQEEFGGVRVGLAFLGWLTATGTTVMLTAFVAAAGIAVGVATSTNAGSAKSQAAQDPKTVGIVGAAVLLVVLFAAYFCGGYVAGRMARFNGLRQGLAVWLWAVFTAAVVAILAALAGSQYDVLSKLNSFPRIPVTPGNLTTGGLIALVVVAAGSLAGALVGGLLGALTGRHFHRRVAKASLAR
jgi:hypothetical protein